MIDDARGDEEIDAGNDGEAEALVNKIKDFERAPGETHERWKVEIEATDFFLVHTEDDRDTDGGEHAQ